VSLSGNDLNDYRFTVHEGVQVGAARGGWACLRGDRSAFARV